MNDAYILSDFTYQVASWIEDTDGNDFIFFELDWDDLEIQNTLYKFSKITILQYYIHRYISLFLIKDFRKNPERYLYAFENEPTPLERLFDDYQIDRTKFKDFKAAKNTPDESVYDMLSEWFWDQEEAFLELWEKITDEVFFILFSNRRFLMKFNVTLSQYISTAEFSLNPQNLTVKGTIKRARIPIWVKKAVYFREHGRCVLCNKDLSGLLGTDRKLHYDHIVPLELMGVNDPTNIQLLCEQCNLQKSSTSIVTDIYYPRWW
jgi:hypothetical protein